MVLQGVRKKRKTRLAWDFIDFICLLHMSQFHTHETLVRLELIGRIAWSISQDSTQIISLEQKASDDEVV